MAAAAFLPNNRGLLLVFGLIWASWAALFYPGVVDADSVDLMLHGESWGYHTWHSPLLGWLWWVVNRIYKGPPIWMAATQGAFLLSAVAIVAQTVRRPAARYAALGLLAVHPAALAMAAQVGKDSICAAALAGLGAMVLRLDRAEAAARPRLLGWAAVLAVFAGCVRVDSIVAVAPLLGFGVWQTVERRRWAATAGLTAAVALGSFVVTQTVTIAKNAERRYPVQVPLSFDLAGISKRTHADVFPEWMHAAGVNPELVQQIHSPHDSNGMFWPKGRQGVPLTKSPDEVRELAQSWLWAVVRFPEFWFAHRLEYASYLLGVRRQAWYHVIRWETPEPALIADPDEFHARFARNPAQVAVERAVLASYETPLFRGWFYALLLPVFLLLAHRSPGPLRGWRLAVGWSAALYLLVMIFGTAVEQTRYLYWPMAALLLAGLPWAAEALLGRPTVAPAVAGRVRRPGAVA